MAKDEKLNPVTTIVFYHGEDPYDGCVNLHDMLELDVDNQTYKRFILDYHINLIKVEDLDETLDAVSIMLSLPALIIKGEDKTEGEEHNLCKALKEWLADERNAGIEEGLKEGERRGERKGIKEGETRFASLTSALLDANRIGDLAKAASDEAFRELLYQEFVL